MLFNKNIAIKLLLFLLLVYFPIFLHLGTMAIQLWDESRLAINAYEMFHNGQYIVTYFEDKPDMWNTKPPLMIWLQVLFMKIIGINELALRLPSAFAALFTCGGMMYFAIRYWKSYWFGLIAVLVLLTSEGYVALHGTRTGDYDALLVFFTTTYILSFWVYLFYNDKIHYLHLFFASLALACLTKGISACFFLPALAIYTLLNKKLLLFLKQKWFYIDFMLFLTVVFSYYLLREYLNPGYLNAVGENELWGRYNAVVEEHKFPFDFYYQKMISTRFTYWYLLVPCGILLGATLKNTFQRQFTYYVVILNLFYFLVISKSQTKLDWYDMPMYPFLALIVAIFVYNMFLFFKENDWGKNYLRINIVPYLALFLLFVRPYNAIIEKVYLPVEEEWAKQDYDISYYLKKKGHQLTDTSPKMVFWDAYSPHLDFYIKKINNSHSTLRHAWSSDFSANDVVIVRKDEHKKQISALYDTQTIDEYHNVTVYKIIAKKITP